jgi:chromate transporter
MADGGDASDATRRPRSLGELFAAFNRMSLQGFGGVLPVAQHELVERQRWLTKAEFTELLSTGQVLPGPNVVNMALMFGDRHHGWRGALAALAGMIAAPLAIVLALAALYARFVEAPAVAGALRGMGAVAGALVLAGGLKLVPTLRTSPLGRVPATLEAATSFVTIAWLRVPLVWVVLAIGSASMALAGWRMLRRRAAP